MKHAFSYLRLWYMYLWGAWIGVDLLPLPPPLGNGISLSVIITGLPPPLDLYLPTLEVCQLVFAPS